MTFLETQTSKLKTQTSLLPYRALYKPKQILSGTGRVAIVTGWTPKEAIAKHLKPEEYAAIGQLYSPTRGINYLIRNLLFNPQVRFLIAINATKEDNNSGSVNCLLDFFRNGFRLGESDEGRACWVINSPDRGYIDLEVTEPALNDLREYLQWWSFQSKSEAIEKVKEINKQKSWEKQYLKPQQFPLPEMAVTQYPGPLYGHRIEGKTIAETWVKIIHRIKTTGISRDTQHDSQWQELINLMAIVTDEPPGFYFPEPNYLPVDRAFIDSYIPLIMGHNKQPGGSMSYTYGERLRSWFGRDQIEGAIATLSQDINSARAVMSLWDATTGEKNISPPCLNHLWLRIVDLELSLTATFRSNDMFSAWVANAMGLRALQQYILTEIKLRRPEPLRLGPLITISESAHIYEDCWESSDRLIQTQYPISDRLFNDPSGSFMISLESGQIVVEWITSGNGEVVKSFQGKTSRQLYQQIAIAVPSLEVEHALYLGTELQKAEIALNSGKIGNYQQDKPLKFKE